MRIRKLLYSTIFLSCSLQFFSPDFAFGHNPSRDGLPSAVNISNLLLDLCGREKGFGPEGIFWQAKCFRNAALNIAREDFYTLIMDRCYGDYVASCVSSFARDRRFAVKYPFLSADLQSLRYAHDVCTAKYPRTVDDISLRFCVKNGGIE